ncbi:hypothetical protein RB614_18805 [Phytohabitans sp. ZYX-F-186]|uniref:PH domain-containing protein n=1 Tax=Phytohabitans maris TaxID=3071409 RepID=A0ABU0ZHN4_9ACTN|nr:hypothetical protein [Phytohabitans sp. ZYX-F-186]MDQ7906569.1 hypothetical protein [Phytohabitans sp. ZYX-F-186]
MGDGYATVSFRPTWRQAIGHGLRAGVVCAPVALLVAFVMPAEVRAAVLVVLPLAAGLAGIVAGRRGGTEIDEYGIRRTVPALPGVASWRQVVDIRPERRRRRTVVAVYLDTGETLRLPAPYDGLWLARDPFFERRLFMLVHLWETHRDWSVHS